MENRPIKFVFVEDNIVNGSKVKNINKIIVMSLNVKLDIDDIILIDDVFYTIINSTISIDTETSEALDVLILEKTTYEEFENCKYSNRELVEE